MGWVEALTGLGLIVGPIIGSSLYAALGYSHTFFIYGSMLFFLAFVIKLNFPDGEVDESQDDRFMESGQRIYEDDLSSFKNELTPEKHDEFEKDYDDEYLSISSQRKVTVCGLLSNARFTFAALASCLCYFAYSFLEPILAERLTDFDLT